MLAQMLPTDVEMNIVGENSEKLKIAFWVEGTFGDHLLLVIILSAILDGSHYEKTQKWQLQLIESI